uniref:DUF547 domain-containing protein n=1 Tax=Derxia lacustris TaxID=764842 RepID=UPI002E267C2B
PPPPMNRIHTSASVLSRRRALHLLGAAVALPLLAARPVRAATGFDHAHAAWTALLRKHVVPIDGGNATQLGYAGMQADRAEFKRYLAALSAVGRAEFDGWSKPQRQAFLMNAYNAFTVELILTRYPDLVSIKDIGTLLTNPWKQKFVPLLGSTVTLDNIEQDMLRKRGAYDDPRLHFAVNCASIGCPALRAEAYVAERLDAQLDEQALRFLSDRSRNRYDPETRKLQVSKIFDWYGEDFTLGHRGITSVAAFLGRHADQLADAPADRAAVRAGRVPIGFLDYDWKLNDVPRHA